MWFGTAGRSAVLLPHPLTACCCSLCCFSGNFLFGGHLRRPKPNRPCEFLPGSIALFICHFGLLTGIWTLPVYLVFAFIDPACLDYAVLNKAHIWILHASHESTAFRDTDQTMDPASRLFRVRQGNRSIEDYVVDFCGLCYLVAFNDVALKDIFRQGLDEPIRSQLPGGKIHWTLEQYIDYALLLAGSSFTVRIADEGPCDPPVFTKPESDHVMTTTQKPHRTASSAPKPAQVMSGIIQVTSEPYHAIPAKPKSAHVTSTKSQFTHVTSSALGSAHAIPVVPEPVHKMAAIPKPVHKMAATHEPHQSKIISSKSHLAKSAAPKADQVMPDPPVSSQVRAAHSESSQVTAGLSTLSQTTADFHEPSQVAAVVPEPSQATVDLHEPSQVAADLHEPSQVTAVVPESSQATADLHEPSQATAGLHELGQDTAVLHESRQVTADHPESSQVTADLPESSQDITTPLHDMAASTGPRQATAVLPEPHQVPSDLPKPRHISADPLEPCRVSADLLEPSRVSADPPGPRHVSADPAEPMLPSHAEPTLPSHMSTASTPSRQAGIPLSTVLPVMAVAILSVWATHCAPEASSVQEFAPMPPEVSASAVDPPKEAASTHELTATSDHESAPVPPEVVAPAAEPPMGAASKSSQVNKPEATAARNQNSIGDKWRKKPWEKPGSVGGPVLLWPNRLGDEVFTVDPSLGLI
ncbi:hypothetical protein M9458_007897 [Cirrhinus mrigala]|uniref:Uncharacterized protein n=1 Tax=Cirrhinus mrigala TaxID=683832 RepID=A0ABD0RLD0_CIRMR